MTGLERRERISARHIPEDTSKAEREASGFIPFEEGVDVEGET